MNYETFSPVGPVTHVVTLTREDVLALVMRQDAAAQHLEQQIQSLGIPASAEVIMHVPGGGDWANLDLTLGIDVPHLQISWTTEK